MPKDNRYTIAEIIERLIRAATLEQQLADLTAKVESLARPGPPGTQIQRVLYPKKEAARMLSLSVSSLNRLIALGELKVRRLGGRVLIPRKELEKFSERDHGMIWPRDASGKIARIGRKGYRRGKGVTP